MYSAKASGYYYKNVPGPDEGYAWLVAVACFTINFLLAGLSRSVSVLYIALIDMYGVTRQDASLPFSVRASVRNMAGPLIGLLAQKYGIRKITTLGGFVSALGSMLCYFAPNVLWLTIFWGGIHGLGFGLSTVIHMMIINQYFDKYKASAMGFGYSGDCFGTLIFPVIIEYLLDAYNIRGTFLILGAIVLNVVPMAMLLRKPTWLRNEKRSNYSKNISSVATIPVFNTMDSKQAKTLGSFNEAFVNSNIDLTERYHNDSISVRSDATFTGFCQTPRSSVRGSVANISIHSSPLSCSHRIWWKTSDISNLKVFERHHSLPPLCEKKILPQAHVNDKNIQNKVVDSEFDTKSDWDRNTVRLSARMRIRRASSTVGQMAHDLVHRVRSASFASQVAQEGFIGMVGQSTDEEIPETNTCQDEVHPKINIVDSNSIEPNSNNCNHESASRTGTKENQPGILKLFFATNTKPIFILISMSMGVYAFLFVGVLTVIMDYAVDNGVSPDDGKYLIIGFSITDLIGRLSFGQVIDRKLMKLKNYAGFTMLLMGIFVAVIPLNRSFSYMIVSISLYGLVQGGTAIMFPILVSNYMEKREEAVAMGCLNFYGGILLLLLAPMIGFFRDQSGSYDWVFHILGFIVGIVGLIWQLEPLIIKCQNREKWNHTEDVIITKL